MKSCFICEQTLSKKYIEVILQCKDGTNLTLEGISAYHCPDCNRFIFDKKDSSVVLTLGLIDTPNVIGVSFTK